MSVEKTLDIFEKRGFKTAYFKTPVELNDFLKSEIGIADVGMGGSITLKQLGVYESLSATTKVYWHAVDSSPETFASAEKAEVYILSANAVSETGEIVNIDGRGNRVSGSIFGSNRKKVFFICGTNKLEPTLERAVWRAKNIAAPHNAQRLGLKTPCAVKADKCYNCNSPQRICRVIAVHTNPTSSDTYLVFVEGDWGY